MEMTMKTLGFTCCALLCANMFLYMNAELFYYAGRVPSNVSMGMLVTSAVLFMMSLVFFNVSERKLRH